jgi:peptidoglycan/xylan/chitin deacetylase (PgdA/CDA1 family)
MSRWAEVGTVVLGSSAVSTVARSVTRHQLRVLAYHGVNDPVAFERQITHLTESYQPVSASRVIAAASGHAPLPDRAVWVTFDDGRPDVIEHAMPILSRHRVPAALFVVAGLVDSTEPFWWEVVEQAVATGAATDRSTLARLKRTPDADRRAEVAKLRQKVETLDVQVRTRQLTSDDLRAWLTAGNDVGSHSWDHPCLDQCSPDAQAGQIRRAHEFLTELVGDPPGLFAYPNGNFAGPVDVELRRLDYRVGLLFDHRLADVGRDPLQMSRLRVDSQADLPRFRAIVSGGHSALYRSQQRVSGVVGHPANGAN